MLQANGKKEAVLKKFVRYYKPSFSLRLCSFSDFPCLVEIVQSNQFREHVSINCPPYSRNNYIQKQDMHIFWKAKNKPTTYLPTGILLSEPTYMYPLYY